MFGSNLPLPTPSSFEGRTYIVTGANSGLGYECAKYLVQHASRVILAVRSQARGDEAKTKIEEDTGRTGVAGVWLLDLASYDSVKAFAKRACEELDRIDGVIENASVALEKWSTAENLETSLTINVVSTFLLAMLLLPKLKADAKRFGIQPHLVVVGSGVGFMGTAGTLESIQGDIIEALNSEEALNHQKNRYPLSKLLQTYVTRELASLQSVSDTNVVINYVNPGICMTDLDRNAGLVFKIQLWIIRRLIGRTAEMGSRTLLHAVVADTSSHGKYLDNCEADDKVPSWIVSTEGQAVQKRVWSSVAACLNKIQPRCVQKALGDGLAVE